MSEPAPVLGFLAPPELKFRFEPGGVLVLPLPPVMRFDALKLHVRELLGNPPGRFAGARVRLDFGARDLDLLEVRRLAHMVREEFEAEVVGLICPNESLRRMAERELKLKISTDAGPAPEATRPAPEPVEEQATDIVSEAAPAEDEELDEGTRTLVVHGTVRSGGVVRYAGDVQVFGDVNPGAQLIAGGNILVFGALKGMAHAGARGDDRALILAFDMRATQLRVGKVIGLTQTGDPDRPSRGYTPEVAFVQAGSIVVEPYKGRLPGTNSNSKETP
jgi:septum site-determining protein MinC